jgi:nucleoid-associated protein YgaU
VKDIDKGTQGSIKANGGNARADASGGNGNRTGQAAKKAAQKVTGKRRGGDAFAGDDPLYENGHGRRDGRSGAATLDVNTDPQRGRSIGGYLNRPSPLRGPRETVVVKEGDTLHGLAARVYGDGRQHERLYTLNRDILLGRTTLEAGTVLRV